MAAIYIHVPFCTRRCRYCDFYSGEPLDGIRGYGGLVVEEARLRPRPEGRATSIYFGGGTPSLLPPEEVAQVLEGLDRLLEVDPAAEVSLEVNPSSAADLRGYRVAGVNRVSVGVQSLDDRVLRLLGRGHLAREALETLGAAARADYEHISVDLIYGLPGSVPGELRTWVHDLVARGADHVSTYSLEIHPGTLLHEDIVAGRCPPLDTSDEEEQEDILAEALRETGLRRYEVSNFAFPGCESRHNSAYWDGSPYVGLGPGAHSYDPLEGPWGSRRWNAPDLANYRSRLSAGRLPGGEAEQLDREDALLETLFLSLRRAAPLDLHALSERYELDPGTTESWFARLEARGLVARAPEAGWEPLTETLRRADGIALWLHPRLLGRLP